MATATDLSTFTQDYLAAKSLARVSDSVDKREGAIIYDTIVPTSAELAGYYANLSAVQKQAYARTATGGFLDLIVEEIGMSREKATYTTKKATFADDSGNPMIIPIGNRFSTISTDTPINYLVSAVYTDDEGNTIAGSYKVVCETIGTDGNGYTGNLLPVTFISGLATAVMSDTLIPGQDEEDDETLRARYFAKIGKVAFGGNIAQYREYFEAIDGVGAAQIYPTWNGGGTVKCSVVDASYAPISTDFITEVQKLVDPCVIAEKPIAQGLGLGMAPIGHKVTITTPTELVVNITATVSVETSYTLAGLKSAIEEALGNYITALKKAWAIGDVYNTYSTKVYMAKVTSTIIGVVGVSNVTSVSINGAAADLALTENATLQQLPKLGTVTLNVGS